MTPNLHECLDRNDLAVFHLSHTDLDGYGAQYVTKRLFPQITLANADYHEAIDVFSGLLEQAKCDAGDRPCLFLITDISLGEAEAEQVNKAFQAYRATGRQATLVAIDHHKSSRRAAARFPWMYVDVDSCATKLTFEFLDDWMDGVTKRELAAFVEIVNTQDLWLEDHPLFYRAILMADAVFEATHVVPADLDAVRRAYVDHLLDSYFDLIRAGVSARELEARQGAIRAPFLSAGLSEEARNDQNIPVKYLAFRYVYEQTATSGIIPTVEIEGERGLLFYNWPAQVFQHVSHFWLQEDPRHKFMINVRRNGGMSLRARGQMDVQQMAGRYFNGGGHPNAAGGDLRKDKIKCLDEALAAVSARVGAVQIRVSP